MTSEVNGNHNGNHNGNNCEYSNVTVVNSRCVNYLLTKLRNKETQAKVGILYTGYIFFKKENGEPIPTKATFKTSKLINFIMKTHN